MTHKTLSRYMHNGLQITAVDRPQCREYYITGQEHAASDFRELLGLLAKTLDDLDAALVSIEVFGVDGNCRSLLEEVLQGRPCPVMWLEGRYDSSASLQGFQAWALSGLPLTPLYHGDSLAGMAYEMDGMRYCRVCGLMPEDVTASRDVQALSVFSAMEEVLSSAGMRFSDVVRTWFYNRNMLEWYDTFNAVRTAFFEERGIFNTLVPASTGIGCRNGGGAALTAGLLAIQGAGSTVTPVAVPSPLQCPSLEYGSAFSRAVEFSSGALRRLLISGTASIEPGGRSIHHGDVERQVHLTLCVVQAILTSRGMNWSHISRAIAYFKYAEDAPTLARCLRARGIASLPVLLAHTDICRDDLLFELEADALL